MHGGALGGLAMMGLAFVGWCVFRLTGLRSPIATSRQAALLALLILACGLTAIANPYGVGLPRTWLEIMRSPVVARLIEEHARLDIRGPDAWLILMLALTYAAAIASIRPWRPRFIWIVPIFWLFETFLRVRHSPLFAITASLAIAEMLPHTRVAEFLARPGRDLFQFPTGEANMRPALDWRPALVPLLVVLLALWLQASGKAVPVLGRGWVKLDPDHWPVELLPELKEVERSHPNGTRIFNDFLYGGFLIYHTPGLKVFIDDRCELYGDARLIEFFDASTRSPSLTDVWAREYKIPYALVATGTVIDQYLARSSAWNAVRRTATSTFYRKADI
jgi:hypothetical protein